MYTETYKFLKSRIGADGAKAGVRFQYAKLAQIATGIIGIIALKLNEPSWTNVACFLLVFFAATAVYIYTKLAFARAITERLGIKVGLLGIPNLGARSFDAWLESVKSRPKR